MKGYKGFDKDRKMDYKITPKKCKHCYYKTNACFNKNGIKCFIGNLKNKFTKKGIR